MRSIGRPRLVFFFLLCGMSSLGFAAPQKSEPSSLRVSIPGKKWAFAIDAPGFTVKQDDTQGSGRRYLLAENDKLQVILSVTLEKSDGPAELSECRRTLQQRAESKEITITDIDSHDVNGIPVLEYLVPEVGGIPLRQRNVFACIPKEDVYANLQLSKVLYQPEDEKLFASILNAAHFDSQAEPAGAENGAGSAPNVRQLMENGNRAFQVGNIAGAVYSYQRALDSEKSHPTINRTGMRILIDNLGMAYGIAGNPDKARETFEYGVSWDPDYPLFYYNIACIYGQRKDLENSILYLQKAFAKKENVVSGEKIPDPRADSSFASFKNDDQFVKAMNDLLGSPQ